MALIQESTSEVRQERPVWLSDEVEGPAPKEQNHVTGTRGEQVVKVEGSGEVLPGAVQAVGLGGVPLGIRASGPLPVALLHGVSAAGSEV
jgi:hypothetical protein